MQTTYKNVKTESNRSWTYLIVFSCLYQRTPNSNFETEKVNVLYSQSLNIVTIRTYPWPNFCFLDNPSLETMQLEWLAFHRAQLIFDSQFLRGFRAYCLAESKAAPPHHFERSHCIYHPRRAYEEVTRSLDRAMKKPAENFWNSHYFDWPSEQEPFSSTRGCWCPRYLLNVSHQFCYCGNCAKMAQPMYK